MSMLLGDDDQAPLPVDLAWRMKALAVIAGLVWLFSYACDVESRYEQQQINLRLYENAGAHGSLTNEGRGMPPAPKESPRGGGNP